MDKQIIEIQDQLAKEYGYRDWLEFKNKCGNTPDLDVQIIAKIYANLKLKEAEAKIDLEIDVCEIEKTAYKKHDDQYSWSIVDDEQTTWEKAKEIVSSLQTKNQTK